MTTFVTVCETEAFLVCRFQVGLKVKGQWTGYAVWPLFWIDVDDLGECATPCFKCVLLFNWELECKPCG
jgi:hypothetical protein